MPRFNATLEKPTTKTVNLAGGEAFSQSARLEIASILLTSMVQDQYYRKAEDTMTRVADLVAADPLFAAKAAVYARNEHGLRSISHVVAGELGKHASGERWKREFYAAVVRRPDDITEILSYYRGKHGKKLPTAMKRGLADSFNKFDGYQIAKYKGEGRGLKLVDAVNLLHPRPTNDKAKWAIGELVAGTLKSTETWEAKLSAAGKDEEAKEGAWRELLTTGKLGYMALLKNLRNISEQAPEMVDLACTQLVDEKAIRKSLVFPFRFVTAYNELGKTTGTAKIRAALSKAADISLGNVPELPGRTVVILDTSGSMSGKPAEIASPFAVALCKKLGADLVVFATTAAYLNIDPNGSIFGGVDFIAANNGKVGHGTDFHAAVKALKAPYDRLIFLSDMQGWIGFYSPAADFKAYKAKYNVEPKVFSFDVTGYGTLQFPEKDVYAVAGISDKVFEIIGRLEEDREALVKTIDAVKF